MGYICDFCGDQRSIVYCRSDAACLCLSCDRKVHSANALSRRHTRTLLCEKCNLQPALVRCVEEGISLCHNCDWICHKSFASSCHQKETINCYAGCPSASELSSIWPFFVYLPTVGGTCQQELGLMRITKNGGHPANNAVQDVCRMDDSTIWVSSSSLSTGHFASHTMEHSDLSMTTNLQKPCTDSWEFSSLYEDLNLSLETFEELFHVASNPEELLENGAIDSLIGKTGISTIDSDGHAAAAAAESLQALDSNVLLKESAGALVNAMQAASSNAASADSIMSAKTDSILCCNTRPALSTLSFSSPTGETKGGDHRDCLAGEPPLGPPHPETSFLSGSHSNAVTHCMEKKKTTKSPSDFCTVHCRFEKKVRHESLKARADMRRRVKGRLVKTGNAYDYDRLSKTRSY